MSTDRSVQSRRPVLPATPALLVQGAVILFFLAGSSAPTPLYATYQADWHFSSVTTTVVFGVYALAVLAALLVAGRLSDHVGRRPVLLGAVAVQIATMVVFLDAHGVGALFVARVVQGLATGAASGAVGAAMVDLHPERGTLASAVAPVSGTALGAIGAGLLVAYLPWPTHLVYAVLLGVFALLLVLVWFTPETVGRRPGALASLRPRVGTSPAVRGPVLAAVPALVALWALGGYAGSLGPALVRHVAGTASPVLAGLPFFLMPAVGALVIVRWRAADPAWVMPRAMAALAAGTGLALLGVLVTSGPLLLVGFAVAGIGFGGGFQASVRSVLPLAAEHERAAVLSVIYVVSYLSLGLPAVVGGLLVVRGGGLVATAYEYGAVVVALAVAALVASLRRRPVPALDVRWAECELAHLA